MNTLFNYLYRDGGNWKQPNMVVLNGCLSQEQKETILDCLNEGEYFIPSQVGLPEKRFKEQTDLDHCWFELCEDDFEETAAEPTVDITPEELVKAFCDKKDKWNDTVFPSQEQMDKLLEVLENSTHNHKAILIEEDYKGSYERYALTPEEFNNEFAPCLAEGMPHPSVEGESWTLRPLVHMWYEETTIGSESWNNFFTDMEFGLPESDIENGNLAYIREDFSLKQYLPKANAIEKTSLDLKIQSAASKVNKTNLYDKTIDAPDR